MPLEDDEIQRQAQLASWKFDFDPRRWNGDTGDSAVYPGQGVSDLDKVIFAMQQNPKAVVYLDIGLINDDWRQVTTTDVQKLKDAYISFYGTTDKPPIPDALGTAVQLNS